MNSLGKMVLTAALALALAVPAQAQRGFGGRGMGQGPAALVLNEGGQKELKLTKDQIEKAQAAAQKVMEKQKEAFSKLQGLDREEAMAKMGELMKTINDDTFKALNDILKPEQTARLKQIYLQQRSADAFADA